MSTEENKATVRRWIEEGWNQRNWAVFDELAASNWIYHDPSLPNVPTLEDYKRWATEIRNAFPDNHSTIEDMIAEGDQVVVRGTFRGTNSRSLEPDEYAGHYATTRSFSTARVVRKYLLAPFHVRREELGSIMPPSSSLLM
jgi:predicted ester cyclase